MSKPRPGGLEKLNQRIAGLVKRYAKTSGCPTPASGSPIPIQRLYGLMLDDYGTTEKKCGWQDMPAANEWMPSASLPGWSCRIIQYDSSKARNVKFAAAESAAAAGAVGFVAP